MFAPSLAFDPNQVHFAKPLHVAAPCSSPPPDLPAGLSFARDSDAAAHPLRGLSAKHPAPRFPAPRDFNAPAHAGMLLDLPHGMAAEKVAKVHVYAVGNLVVDGRRARVAGWLSHASITAAPSSSRLLLAIAQPGLWVARVQCAGGGAACTLPYAATASGGVLIGTTLVRAAATSSAAPTPAGDVDALDGEAVVGHLAVMPSGKYRFYAVVQERGGAAGMLTVCPPSAPAYVAVDDDWELSEDGSTLVSLADMVRMRNPHQFLAAEGLPSPALAAYAQHATPPMALAPAAVVACDAGSERARPRSAAEAAGGESSSAAQLPSTPPRSPSSALALAPSPPATCASLALLSRGMQRAAARLRGSAAAGAPATPRKAKAVHPVADGGAWSAAPGACTCGAGAGEAAGMGAVRYAVVPPRAESKVPVLDGVVDDWL